MYKGLKWLSVLTAVGMFIVLLNGALVTKTESGQGCGDDWPLCNGRFVPAYTIESMIEYSHRAISGIVGLMVIVSAAWVLKSVRQRKDARFYAVITLLFTVFQALLGAAAVMWQQSSAVMALHFGISLIAFAGSFLLAVSLSRLDQPAHESGWGEQLSEPRHPISGRFQFIVWFTTFYTYVVIYLGAFVRHTESFAGCQGWPLCNNKLIPSLQGETGIAFLHRVAAAVLLLLIFWLWLTIRRKYPDYSLFRTAGNAAFVLVILQILSGGLVVGSLTSANWYLLFSLIHTVLIAGLFGVLCYLSMLLWRMNRQGIRGGENRTYAMREEKTADDHAGALVYNSNE
mgnify:CR=1 FL=1